MLARSQIIKASPRCLVTPHAIGCGFIAVWMLAIGVRLVYLQVSSATS